MDLTVSNRELLRNYKTLKRRLAIGEITQILIEQKDGPNLKLSVEKKEKTPYQSLAEYVRRNPVFVERPKEDLFDERL